MSDAYDTVELKPSWLGCSLLSIGLVVLVAVSLPFLFRNYRVWGYFGEALLLFPALSLVGTIAGLVALRRSSARTVAGIAVITNATVFASCVAAAVIAILR